ncbi:MAG TPA: response regulator [Candidatus Dormibacteraeota bacterium]
MCASEATRVLVTEDDRGVRSFLARALESGGYEPVLAESGEEALAALRDGAPVAVALVDGALPDMHGMRLARTILELPAEEPIALCFVTGGITESSGPRAGVAVLSKPMRLAQLLAMVADLLRWREGGGSPPAERLQELEKFEHAFVAGQ